MGDLAADLTPLFEIVVVVAFALLAASATARAPRTGVAGWWAVVAFGALALAFSLFWLPDLFAVALPARIGEFGLVLLICFPYLLLRFTATFETLPRVLEIHPSAHAAHGRSRSGAGRVVDRGDPARGCTADRAVDMRLRARSVIPGRASIRTV